eukprot:gnl/MRDRNA2_/MRDRNA2_31375_c0_seq2.p1 gnl/MRDRNA2_/MRDRNA2_31375_c0~~gnl/MRDRNA2_/MRDRNA2_31375_c0_seq2.p1  ORF type:complete len:635 (-),score=108.33 gnl/MRDRNA2_/MRDRNA2_31375_c0_seq2:170-2074(-)
MPNVDEIESIFRRLGANKDRQISRDELEYTLIMYDPHTFGNGKAKKFLTEMDLSGEGIIYLSEFQTWMMAGGPQQDSIMDGFIFSALPRWMIHKRPDKIPKTSLRAGPHNHATKMRDAVLEAEIVEIIAGPKGGEGDKEWVLVRLALTSVQGWVRRDYLDACPEGTSDHGRLSSEAKTGDREVKKTEVDKHSKRFQDVSRFLRESSAGNLAAEQVWFITGHFIGETGMKHGPKETMFHGTHDGVVDAIVQTGFDDKYAANGKFGTGLYFSPEAMTSYGYGHELFLCEVALGSEDQRETAKHCSSDYTWQSLLESGKRSVQCHKEDFGQEERIVYHCTQCKPVYVIKVREAEIVLPRWMLHQRTDHIPMTSLRKKPENSEGYVPGDLVNDTKASALNGEVVEVLDRGGLTNDYVYVQLALCGSEGWIKKDYLQECPEGTQDHGRLAASDSVKLIELDTSSTRVKELQQFIALNHCSSPKCHCYGRVITIEKAWQVRGQFLGETGMVTGPKTTLFHGCPDSVVHSIANGGFDDSYSSGGAFGAGSYFSPQSCKAWSYAENHLLVCEVALGSEANRLTLTQQDRSLTYEKVKAAGKRSVQCHSGAPFNHEERVVYRNTQCKPVYLIKTTETSPGGGV